MINNQLMNVVYHRKADIKNTYNIALTISF